MKKIGILTVHYNLNYGAVLQAYATYMKLKDLGFRACIINYINPMGKNELKVFPGGSAVNNMRAAMFVKKRLERISRFKEFMNNNYELTNAVYDYRDLNENMFDFDVYLTGSDQTFNLCLAGDVEMRKIYFLPWVTNAKKISYASSMGEMICDLSKNDALWIKNALSSYAHLSVRENAAADFIENMGIKRPEVVVDPTLLMTKEEWDDIALPSNYTNEEYILFYSVLSEPWVVKQVKRISKEMGLKVVAPHFQNRYELSSGFIRAEECGPLEFLGLIKNAKFICTTSFHGTIFSLLYNKPFVSFVLQAGNRISGLLNMVGQGYRMIRENDDVNIKTLINIDFEATNRILATERERSTEILKKFIGESA